MLHSAPVEPNPNRTAVRFKYPPWETVASSAISIPSSAACWLNLGQGPRWPYCREEHGAQIVYRLRVPSFNPCTLKSLEEHVLVSQLPLIPEVFEICSMAQRDTHTTSPEAKDHALMGYAGPESPEEGQAGQNSPPFGFQGQDDRGLPLGHESERCPFWPAVRFKRSERSSGSSSRPATTLARHRLSYLWRLRC